MLSYFRINDPYRLVIIYVALILFRLPILFSPDWNTVPELGWMIVGERINEGAMLYVDIWDDIGPLSAWVFGIIDLAFGRSPFALKIIGLFLFFLQIFFLNYISLKHKMYNENNYLPALFYGLLGIVFFNVTVLSPQLMGLTFVLFSINHLFNHIETRNKTDGNLLNIGIYIGAAALFYLPYLIFMFVHIMSLLFFTNTLRRRYLLLLYGASIPFTICWLFYIWKSDTQNFFGHFVHSLFVQNSFDYLSANNLLLLGGITLFFFGIASFRILSGFGFTVFQVRIQKIMFFAFVVCFFKYLLYAESDGYSLVMFFPWTAFFLSHFFLKVKNSLKRELSFVLYFLSVLALYLGTTFHIFNFHEILSFDKLIVDTSSEKYAEMESKKTLVLGPDPRPYAFSRQATPYFNWKLSKEQLENLNYYDNLEEVDKNLRNDMPDVIIDQIGLVPKLFDRIPRIGAEYEQVNEEIYRRIKSGS
ncbi:MAG: hypothetical protein MI975_21520 [Cytophagales bacterium]|nr:hypothetical protein [Cytophagales bacterium]